MNLVINPTCLTLMSWGPTIQLTLLERHGFCQNKLTSGGESWSKNDSGRAKVSVRVKSVSLTVSEREREWESERVREWVSEWVSEWVVQNSLANSVGQCPSWPGGFKLYHDPFLRVCYSTKETTLITLQGSQPLPPSFFPSPFGHSTGPRPQTSRNTDSVDILDLTHHGTGTFTIIYHDTRGGSKGLHVPAVTKGCYPWRLGVAIIHSLRD